MNKNEAAWEWSLRYSQPRGDTLAVGIGVGRNGGKDCQNQGAQNDARAKNRNSAKRAWRRHDARRRLIVVRSCTLFDNCRPRSSCHYPTHGETMSPTNCLTLSAMPGRRQQLVAAE